MLKFWWITLFQQTIVIMLAVHSDNTVIRTSGIVFALAISMAYYWQSVEHNRVMEMLHEQLDIQKERYESKQERQTGGEEKSKDKGLRNAHRDSQEDGESI